MTSQRQNRYIRIIHPRNRIITAEDITRRIKAGLANVRISRQTVRRRLRESGFRARRPVVGPILKQRHMTVKLAWVRARRRLTPGNISFSAMIPDFHLVLAVDVIVCIVCVLRISVCTSPTDLEAEVLWSGLEFVMMIALISKLCKKH